MALFCFALLYFPFFFALHSLHMCPPILHKKINILRSLWHYFVGRSYWNSVGRWKRCQNFHFVPRFVFCLFRRIKKKQKKKIRNVVKKGKKKNGAGNWRKRRKPRFLSIWKSIKISVFVFFAGFFCAFGVLEKSDGSKTAKFQRPSKVQQKS